MLVVFTSSHLCQLRRLQKLNIIIIKNFHFGGSGNTLMVIIYLYHLKCIMNVIRTSPLLLSTYLHN